MSGPMHMCTPGARELPEGRRRSVQLRTMRATAFDSERPPHLSFMESFSSESFPLWSLHKGICFPCVFPLDASSDVDAGIDDSWSQYS